MNDTDIFEDRIIIVKNINSPEKNEFKVYPYDKELLDRITQIRDLMPEDIEIEILELPDPQRVIEDLEDKIFTIFF